MFGFLKRTTPSPEQQANALCAALLPAWRTVLDGLQGVAGPLARPYEAGLFIGCIALMELAVRRPQADALGLEFAARWLLHIEQLTADAGGPAAEQLNELLFERYRAYRTIMTDIDASPVQLVLMLLEYCSGRDAAGQIGGIMAAVPVIAQVKADIASRVRTLARSTA